MNHEGHFRRLTHDLAPGVCERHRLMNYPKVVALMDAAKIREQAIADTPSTLASAGPCSANEENWHIYIPTKNHMRMLRKRARRKHGSVNVPRETSTEDTP